MNRIRSVALLQSHQRLAPTHAYYLPDLVEICGLAAAVRDHVDDVHLPVSPSDRDPLARFDRFLRRHRPDLVGISSFTCGAGSAREYARLARSYDARVVVGGFHASALPEEVLGWPGVDAVVRGEGEEALRRLVRTGSPEGIPGMSYRDNGGFVHNPVPPVVEDLDSLPLPLRELRPERFGFRGLDYHTDTIYTSRGCRGRCRFCANHTVGRSWRGRSVESILTELLTIPPARGRRRKTVKIWDSSFLTDPEQVERLCTAMIEHRLARSFRFVAECRVEDVVRAAEILPTMHRAGIERIGCGVESPNRRSHKRLQKGINLNHVHRAAELLSAARIQFTKFLILGHPDETESDMLAYPDYALSHGVDLQRTTFFVMTPYPGTDMADEYAQRGWVESRNWDLYTNFGSVIQPNGTTADRLQILHCAVATAYGMRRRFVEGASLWRILERILEPLLVFTSMSLMKADTGHAEIEHGMMEALGLTCGRWQRPPGARRPSRFALRLHHPEVTSVVMGILRHEDREELVIRQGGGRLRDGRGVLRELHLSVPRLAELLGGVDSRRTGHDLMTLRQSPRRLRPSWALALTRDVADVLRKLVRLATFHLQTSIRRDRHSAGTT